LLIPSGITNSCEEITLQGKAQKKSEYAVAKVNLGMPRVAQNEADCSNKAGATRNKGTFRGHRGGTAKETELRGVFKRQQSRHLDGKSHCFYDSGSKQRVIPQSKHHKVIDFIIGWLAPIR